MFKLPLMIDCETFESFVSNYLEGNLSVRQQFVFKTHLLFCRECRVYLKEYELAIALAASEGDKVFSDLGMGDVPEKLIDAVIKAQEH